MIHHWRRPGKPSQDWKGAAVAAMALVATVLAVLKGGWLVLAPFVLAGVVLIAILIYLRWLGGSAS